LLAAVGGGAALLAVTACGPGDLGSATTVGNNSIATENHSVAPPASQQATSNTGGSDTGNSGSGNSGGSGGGSGAAPSPRSITADSNDNLVYDCGGLPQINIEGDSDVITLLGTCNQLNVEGNSDKVSVAYVTQINFSGTSNMVTWGSGPNGGQPQINDQGTTNQAVHGTVSAPSGGSGSGSGSGGSGGGGAVVGSGPLAPTSITVADTTVSYNCGNESVTIMGGNSNITLTGTCQSVTVFGGNNTVHIQVVGTINVPGANNHITWQAGPGGGSPTVQDAGVNNTVSQG
jgi:hypothetical protein